MATAQLTSRMVFLDEENPSWDPGQVLIITESVGETSCPVFAVHHNHTYFRPASSNLFVLKEANAAARALKVRECICDGPRKNELIRVPCLDESIGAYFQDDTESEFFGRFPLGYRVDVDELQITSGVLTSSFPTFYYDKLPGLIDQFCRFIDLNHGFSGDEGFVYANTSYYTEPDFTFLYYECNTGNFLGAETYACEVGETPSPCRVRVTVEARFYPCETETINLPIGENFGLFYITVSIVNCTDEDALIAPTQSTTGVYHAWRKTGPRINLLDTVTLTKTQDYSEINTNTDNYEYFEDENSPIDWPETLTLIPVY